MIGGDIDSPIPVITISGRSGLFDHSGWAGTWVKTVPSAAAIAAKIEHNVALHIDRMKPIFVSLGRQAYAALAPNATKPKSKIAHIPTPPARIKLIIVQPLSSSTTNEAPRRDKDVCRGEKDRPLSRVTTTSVDSVVRTSLLDRLRDGDPAAFDEIYDAHRAGVYAFLARMSGDRTLAEDLLQETFIRLARKSDSLDTDDAIRPWLFTVARNLFVSHRRWNMLDLTRLAELATAPSPNTPTPFDLSTASETERRLERAIIDLPPKYKEALLLVAVEGLTPAAAANVIGVRPEALRQRLSRARTLLRESLESER